MLPLLSDSNLPVPAPPLLGGSEHPTTAAHVAEGSLARPENFCFGEKIVKRKR